MDVENLKLVLDAVKAAGDDVRTVAVLYIVSSLISPILTFAFGLCVLRTVFRVIRFLSDAQEAARLMATALGVNVGTTWYLNNTECCLGKIEQLKKKGEK